MANGKSLLKTDDWLAVWLGFLILILVLAGVRPQLPSFRWATDSGFAASVAKKKPLVESFIKEAEAKGEAELAAAGTSLRAAIEKGNRAEIGSAAKKVGDLTKKAKDAGLKRMGGEIGRISGVAGQLISKVFSGENIWRSVVIGISYLILSSIGIALMGGNLGKYIIGFPIIFILAWLSQFIAGNSTVNYWGLEYVIFALAIGLIISNVFGVPAWLMEGGRTEYYIKTGLVILGAGMLFYEVLQAGAVGIVQALLFVFVVWYSCWWLAKKLRVDDDFAAMLSTAVSICGVSAAIAACGAIHGDKKKLSYVTSLVLIVAVPMMVAMPWLGKLLEIP